MIASAEIPKHRAVQVRLSPGQFVTVRDHASDDDRSMSSWIRLAVEAKLANGAEVIAK